MSNLEPITAQPDWRDSYSQDWQATENLPVLPSLYEQRITSQSAEGTGSAPLYAPRPSLPHRHSLAQVESRQQPFSNAHIDRSDSAPAVKLEHQISREQEQPYLTSGAATFQESPRFEAKAPASTADEEHQIHQQQRDDEDDHDDDDDDDEMLDAEERAPGDGRSSQTEAERRAERKKMKRFRFVAALGLNSD